MKNNTLVFNSLDAYETWIEQFENCSDYEEIPVAIDDGWKIAVDLFTDCKSWKTALRRFEKAFGDYSEDIKGWIECMRESVESGYTSDSLKPGWNATEEEKQDLYKYGTYSWGVEEQDDGYWYIFLNISGVYASRERE